MRLMPLITAAIILSALEPSFARAPSTAASRSDPTAGRWLGGPRRPTAQANLDAAAREDAEWVEFASREDRFTCNFPGRPTVAATPYRSEMGAELPARVYSATQGQSRYSVTVVDYNLAQKILTERARGCPEGLERCRGGSGVTGEGYWKQDVRGAMLHATFKYLQRDARVTHLGYNFVDLVEGHQLHLTNRDQTRTFVGIYMHENKLYIMEGTVPPGYPEPALFQQSLGWLDENGIGLRYQSIYSNGLPPPPRARRGPREEGQGRIDADAPGVIKE